MIYVSASGIIIFWEVWLNCPINLTFLTAYNVISSIIRRLTSHKTVDLHVIIVSIIDIHLNVNEELYSTATYSVICNLPQIYVSLKDRKYLMQFVPCHKHEEKCILDSGVKVMLWR